MNIKLLLSSLLAATIASCSYAPAYAQFKSEDFVGKEFCRGAEDIAEEAILMDKAVVEGYLKELPPTYEGAIVLRNVIKAVLAGKGSVEIYVACRHGELLNEN